MSSILDNLNLDEVDVSPARFDATSKATCVEMGETGEGDNVALKIVWELEDAVTSTSGVSFPPGQKVTEFINLVPVGGRSAAMIGEQTKRVFSALLRIPGNAKGVHWSDYTQYVGKRCLLTLKPRPRKDDPSVVYQDFKKHLPLAK